MNDVEERLEIVRVAVVNARVVKDGQLPIWTIYYNPKDKPNGWIARLHVTTKSGSAPTDDTIETDFVTLRRIFSRAGLSLVDRHPSDERQIVESWI
jgi:hypothetical protein